MKNFVHLENAGWFWQYVIISFAFRYLSRMLTNKNVYHNHNIETLHSSNITKKYVSWHIFHIHISYIPIFFSIICKCLSSQFQCPMKFLRNLMTNLVVKVFTINQNYLKGIVFQLIYISVILRFIYALFSKNFVLLVSSTLFM